MLISHVSKFIYLKTLKTAGTSVEIYFEPYCVDPKNYAGEQHERSEEVSNWGIVGARRKSATTWFNHMSAQEVLDRVGPEVWNAYYKFCVVRNPFDKVVSYFWHDLSEAFREQVRRVDIRTVREVFDGWTKLARFPFDAFIYTRDGSPMVDDFIRYEQLYSDMGRVCGKLALPWQPERLGRYKSESRRRGESFEEYYTPAAAARVAEAFAWELSYFGYQAPLPRSSM